MAQRCRGTAARRQEGQGEGRRGQWQQGSSGRHMSGWAGVAAEAPQLQQRWRCPLPPRSSWALRHPSTPRTLPSLPTQPTLTHRVSGADERAKGQVLQQRHLVAPALSPEAPPALAIGHDAGPRQTNKHAEQTVRRQQQPRGRPSLRKWKRFRDASGSSTNTLCPRTRVTLCSHPHHPHQPPPQRPYMHTHAVSSLPLVLSQIGIHTRTRCCPPHTHMMSPTTKVEMVVPRKA